MLWLLRMTDRTLEQAALMGCYPQHWNWSWQSAALLTGKFFDEGNVRAAGAPCRNVI